MHEERIYHSLCNIFAIINTVFDDLKVASIIGIWAEVWKKNIFLRMARPKIKYFLFPLIRPTLKKDPTLKNFFVI